jgi:hypothetical protein
MRRSVAVLRRVYRVSGPNALWLVHVLYICSFTNARHSAMFLYTKI